MDEETVIVPMKEFIRLNECERDLKNILKAALYNEPFGIDLVNRLTTFAINCREDKK